MSEANTLTRQASLVTQAFMFERYGPRLNSEQIAELLGIKVSTLNNQCSAETCPIATYIEGKKRWADYRDAAAYFDACRQRATPAASA